MLQRMVPVALISLLLAGCATVSDQPGEAPHSAEERPRILAAQPPIPEDEDVIYQLLLAEFAGSRGQVGTALDAYLKAMYLTDDPQIASRAARITLYANRDVSGLKAARRWADLDPESAAAWQALGLFLQRNGEAKESADAFRRMLVLIDDPAAGFAQLGAVLASEEDRRQSLETMSLLVDDHADVAEAHLVHAQLALRSGEALRAVSAAEAGLERLPDSRELAMLRAQALVEAGRVEAGVSALRELSAADPEDQDLRLYLARTLVRAGRSVEALSEFRRALRDRPEDPGLLYAAGILTLETGDAAEARQYFLRLNEQGDRVDDARFLLGQIAEDLDRTDEALGWYEQVEGDNFVAASVRRAILLGDQGRVEAARDEVRQLREEFPDEAIRSYLIEGEVLRRNREYDAARDLYNEAIGRHAGNPDLLYGRALIAVYRGDVETAERDLRRVLEDEPDNANALNALGYTLVDLTDRYQEGFDLIRRAHALEPQNPAILDSMGWAHFRLGNHEEALDYLQQAFERMPDAEVAAHLGEVLWTMDRRDEARAIWREGKELDPDNRTLRDTLDRFDP